jgi:hypothetical protein
VTTLVLHGRRAVVSLITDIRRAIISARCDGRELDLETAADPVQRRYDRDG